MSRPNSFTAGLVPFVDASLPIALSPAFASSSSATMLTSVSTAVGAAVVSGIGVAAADFAVVSITASVSEFFALFEHAAHITVRAHALTIAMLRAGRFDMDSSARLRRPGLSRAAPNHWQDPYAPLRWHRSSRSPCVLVRFDFANETSHRAQAPRPADARAPFGRIAPTIARATR